MSQKAIVKRTSSSGSASLFSKFRRFSKSGISDTSSHSMQSKSTAAEEHHSDYRNERELKKKNSIYDHEYAYLYELIDTTSDGKLSTTEFIRALRSNSSVAEVGNSHIIVAYYDQVLVQALDLPSHISKEDDTYDEVVVAFNDMDYDKEGLIDIHKFLRYIDNKSDIIAKRREDEYLENERKREKRRLESLQREEEERLQREKEEEEERLRREKEAAEEEERLQREKEEEEERLRKEKEAAEVEERLRREKEEEDRLAREKAEVEERLKREKEAEEEERRKREKEAEEEERRKREKEEAEQLRREMEEEERLRKEKEVAEEEERLRKEREGVELNDETKYAGNTEAAHSHMNSFLDSENDDNISEILAESSRSQAEESVRLEIARKKERKRALERVRAQKLAREESQGSIGEALSTADLNASPKSDPVFSTKQEVAEEIDSMPVSRNIMMPEEDSPLKYSNDSPGGNMQTAVPRHSSQQPLSMEDSYSTKSFDPAELPIPPPPQRPLHHDEGMSCYGPPEAVKFENGTVTAKYQGYTAVELPSQALDMIYKNRLISRKRPALSFVHTVVLSHNELTALDCSALGSLFNLTSLDLSYNKISKIVGPLPSKLASLKLHRNCIRKVDKAISECSTLRELDLSHNELRSIFGLPTDLESLDISHNFISGELNLRMLSFTPKLTSVAVDGNPVLSKIKNCNAHLLTLIPKLEVINYQTLPRLGQYRKKSKPSSAPKCGAVKPQARGSSVTSSARSSKRKVSPSKRRRKEQQAHVAALARSYESSRADRARILKEQDELANKMVKITAHKILSPAKLRESSERMNSWKPHYLRRLEEQEMAEAEQRAREAEKKAIQRRTIKWISSQNFAWAEIFQVQISSSVFFVLFCQTSRSRSKSGSVHVDDANADNDV